MPTYIPPGNSITVFARNVRRASTGEVVDNATVTAELLDASGQTITGTDISLSWTVAENAYIGTMPRNWTTPDRRGELKVVVNGGDAFYTEYFEKLRYSKRVAT